MPSPSSPGENGMGGGGGGGDDCRGLGLKWFIIAAFYFLLFFFWALTTKTNVKHSSKVILKNTFILLMDW